MRFLHIADVHLGCTRYQLPESPRDFFDAWLDVLRKYAIGEKVDFVIMCGDFFHKRSVPPETMNYAVAGLNLLTFLLYGAFSAAMLLVPYVLISSGGYSPVQAGLALLPLPILMTALSPTMGSLAVKIGPRLRLHC